MPEVALSLDLLTTQTMVTTGILPLQGRAGNRTRDLVISSQKLRPLDHEAGHDLNVHLRLLIEDAVQQMF